MTSATLAQPNCNSETGVILMLLNMMMHLTLTSYNRSGSCSTVLSH